MDAGMDMLGLGDKAKGVGDAIDQNRKKQEDFNKSINDSIELYRKASAAFTNPEQTLRTRGGEMTAGEHKQLADFLKQEHDTQTRAAERAGNLRKDAEQVAESSGKTATSKFGGRLRDAVGLRDDTSEADADIANSIRGVKHFKNLFDESVARVKEVVDRFDQQNLDRGGSRAAGSAAAQADREKNEVARHRAELQDRWEREDAETGKIDTAASARAFAEKQLEEFNRNKFERERTFGSDQKNFRIDRDDTTTGRTAFEGIEAYSRKIQERADDSAARAEKQRAELIQQGEEIKRANREFANAVIGKLGVQ